MSGLGVTSNVSIQHVMPDGTVTARYEGHNTITTAGLTLARNRILDPTETDETAANGPLNAAVNMFLDSLDLGTANAPPNFGPPTWTLTFTNGATPVAASSSAMLSLVRSHATGTPLFQVSASELSDPFGGAGSWDGSIAANATLIISWQYAVTVDQSAFADITIGGQTFTALPGGDTEWPVSTTGGAQELSRTIYAYQTPLGTDYQSNAARIKLWVPGNNGGIPDPRTATLYHWLLATNNYADSDHVLGPRSGTDDGTMWHYLFNFPAQTVFFNFWGQPFWYTVELRNRYRVGLNADGTDNASVNHPIYIGGGEFTDRPCGFTTGSGVCISIDGDVTTGERGTPGRHVMPLFGQITDQPLVFTIGNN